MCSVIYSGTTFQGQSIPDSDLWEKFREQNVVKRRSLSGIGLKRYRMSYGEWEGRLCIFDSNEIKNHSELIPCMIFFVYIFL